VTQALEKREREFKLLDKTHKTMQEQLERAQKDLGGAEHSKDRLHKTLTLLTSQRDELLSKEEETFLEIAELRTKVDTLNNLLRETRENAMQNQMTGENELKKMEGNLEKALARVQKFSAKLSESNSLLKITKQQETQLRSQNEILKSELDEKKEEAERLTDLLSQLRRGQTAAPSSKGLTDLNINAGARARRVSMAPSKMKADSMGEVAADDQENQPALDNVPAARATRSSARFQGKSQ